MTNITKAQALSVYKPPFTFLHGYIFDANHNMVADEPTSKDDPKNAAVRVRGWGRISYMPSPEELQDAIGQHIANALTEYWSGADTISVPRESLKALVRLWNEQSTIGAPDHCHEVPGIWDSDNGIKAGTKCEECAVYDAIRALVVDSEGGRYD